MAKKDRDPAELAAAVEAGVARGMDIVDAIKRGDGANGEVTSEPDVMAKVTVQE